MIAARCKMKRLSPTVHFIRTNNNPTNPFTVLELQNPSNDGSELHKIWRSPDLQALKLWKGSSGKAQNQPASVLDSLMGRFRASQSEKYSISSHLSFDEWSPRTWALPDWTFPSFDQLYFVRKRRSTDFEALKRGKGWSRNSNSNLIAVHKKIRLRCKYRAKRKKSLMISWHCTLSKNDFTLPAGWIFVKISEISTEKPLPL